MGEFVRLEVDDGIGTILLDRPPMNALSRQVQEELRAAAAEAAERTDVRAVVVYGGPKVFAAGADVKEMAGWSYADIVQVGTRLQSAFTAVAQHPASPRSRPSPGTPSAAGCELALCCDFRVAGDNAKLGQPEILLGIIPGAGGTQRLPRLVGPARAKDIVFSGRFVGAEEALAIGLVDRVVAPDDVYDQARAMVEQLCPRPRARAARGEGGDRQRAVGRPGQRAGAGAAAVRRAVRHRGPGRPG